MRRLVLASSLAMARHRAMANGRPPVTNGVYFQARTMRSSLYVRTTFGLLVSHDDGCSFRWVCEQNIGYGGTFDPKYAIATDGTIFATTFTGLRVSRDGGCSFTTATTEQPVGAPGRIADMWIDAHRHRPDRRGLGRAPPRAASPNDVYRSTRQRRRRSSRAACSSPDDLVEERQGRAVRSAARLRHGLSGRGAARRRSARRRTSGAATMAATLDGVRRSPACSSATTPLS